MNVTDPKRYVFPGSVEKNKDVLCAGCGIVGFKGSLWICNDCFGNNKYCDVSHPASLSLLSNYVIQNWLTFQIFMHTYTPLQVCHRLSLEGRPLGLHVASHRMQQRWPPSHHFMWDASSADRPYFLDIAFLSLEGGDRVSVDAEISCHEALSPGKGVIVYVSSETSDVNYLGFLTWVLPFGIQNFLFLLWSIKTFLF